MAELPTYGDVENVRTVPSLSVYDGPPSYDVIATSPTDRLETEETISQNANQLDNNKCGDNETRADSEVCVNSETETDRNSDQGEYTSSAILRTHSLEREKSHRIFEGDSIRLSDSQLDKLASRSRTPSPGRYQKRKSYSPDVRKMRRKVRSRSPNTKYPTAMDGSEAPAKSEEPNEAIDQERAESSASPVDGQEVSTYQGKKELVKGGTQTSIRDVKPNAKSKFNITKVDASNLVDGNLKHMNGSAELDKANLTIDIPEKCDVDNGDVTYDITPGDKDVINGDGVMLKFKGDFLDADMLYEWTLEKKSKYAAQIRNVKMTLESRPPKPRDYVVLSCMVLFCCNLPFGIIALCLSLGINTKYESGQYATARRYSRASLILAILGIAVTCVIVTTCLAALWPDVEHYSRS